MVYTFVGLRPGYDWRAIQDLMVKRVALGPSVVYGMVSSDALLALAARKGVTYVYPDFRLSYDRVKADPDVLREGLAVDMYRVREIIGAEMVNRLGVNGDGVTIAIADTGTDFTIPDLEDAVARDESGRAVSFDPDGQSFVITELVVEREGSVLQTAGKTVDVWDAASFVYTDEAIPSVDQVEIDLNYGAPSVESRSGNYHFGIFRQTIEDNIAGQTVTIDFPVVVIDARTPNVYDTVVVDMSTALYDFLSQYRRDLNEQASQSLEIDLEWPSPKATWNDHSFADESVHTASPGNDLIGLDITNDGVPDFSAGILAYGVDMGGRTGSYFSLLPPIDADGNFINVFFDYESHGSSTASSAASRGTLKRDVYKNHTMLALPGVAPKAKIMGLKVLWFFDLTLGWHYAAGFDWDPVSFAFRYSGKHRADVISNSWGISDSILAFGSTYGFDPISQLANALSLPGYLDPAYPGIVIVKSAGNGGFEYGTVPAPPATLEISVGASTSYHYRAHPEFNFGAEIAGSYDEVVPWSGRGPTSFGEVKPDVVNVGAFAFVDQSSYTGYGDGVKAYDVFGGTSLSAPLTAGTVALVIEEYRRTHDGQTPRADVVKAILASSASDLTYDVFTQGSGRVNAFDAVAAAAEGKDGKFPRRFYVVSTSSWEVASQFVTGSWFVNLHGPVPSIPMVSTKWSAGIVQPGSAAQTSMGVRTTSGNIEARALNFKLIETKHIRERAPSLGNEAWVTLPKDEIPPNTDLMKVTMIFHFSDFADISKWDYKEIIAAQLYDTNVDAARNSRRITNALPFGTASELVVSRPHEKFLGVPKVRIITLLGRAVPIELVVRYYERVEWDWVTRLSVSSDAISAQLSVPTGTLPGVYDGLILVSDNEASTVVPISVLVPITTSGDYGGNVGEMPYDNYAVYGGFDWEWRYESGDWRIFAVFLDRPAGKLDVWVTWSDSRTAIQAHLVGTSGYLIASSEYPESLYEGSGKFRWRSSAGGTFERISATNLQPGLYFLVLHNTLFGATSFADYPEPFTLTVQIG